MTNDVKLGLVLGLGLVLAVAVTYYSKEPPAAGEATAGAVRGTVPPPQARLPAQRAAR